LNISAVTSQLMAFHELYGDLPVYQVVGQTYAALQQLPWLASPVGTVPGPTNYIVCFGQLTSTPAPDSSNN